MTNIKDLSRGDVGAIWAAIRELQFSSNQNNSAIGRSGLLVYDGGVITIENGGLNITGSATISGLLEASGTINMSGTFTASGDVNLNGPTAIAGDTTVTGDFTVSGPTSLEGVTTIVGDTTVTGAFDVDGPMKTTGTLDVEGAMDIKGPSTLNNNLTVAAGKKIALGGLTLENTGTGGGTVNFPNGSVSSGAFGMLAASSIQVEIGAPLVKLSGIGTISGVTPNVYMDGNGQLKKIT
ncbi:hypothetical protein RI444_16540 [Paenarthrobacter sp. AT5]|uniref:hypothetical protein n=1 Tax=Paenarthrobacter TaxID=1742992 RepID=UPI001A996049|nr:MULTISPECIES: hypothetical protein [Paenarthrobacter]QSZ53074.1 hypothetical protein AYX19_08735 [Paenarthrobacter ureafaciens]WOC60107.1 hypothetical protein RI444_16540 [Paenarthrobacter sp. AT5]